MSLIDEAKRWREQWGYVGRGGVVVLFEGKVQGWVDELRNAEHWQPACVAVDEKGRSRTTCARALRHRPAAGIHRMKKSVFALTVGIAASIAFQSAHAHTIAWYSDHIDEAKKRYKECQAKEKADISPTPEEKSDCDNAVVALVTQRSKQPIPQATSAPAPKWKNFGH